MTRNVNNGFGSTANPSNSVDFGDLSMEAFRVSKVTIRFAASAFLLEPSNYFINGGVLLTYEAIHRYANISYGTIITKEGWSVLLSIMLSVDEAELGQMINGVSERGECLLYQ